MCTKEEVRKIVEDNNRITLSEVRKVEDRLDNHIEIYKANGEAVRRNNELILKLHGAFNEYKVDQEERYKKLQPAVDFITTMTFGKKLLIGIASVVAALGAIGLFIKGLR